MQRDNQTKSLPARRWLQFSLRSILLFTAASALLAGFVLAPRVRERAALDWLHEIDARVTTENIGPNWLAKLIGEKYLQTAVAVDLAERKLTDDDVRRLQPLRHLRRLKLSGNSLTDESLTCLPRETLEELGLAHSDITDAGLARLADFPELTRLRVVGSNVTLAAADRLARRRSNLQIDGSLGDALYQETWHEEQAGRMLMREFIFRCETAARWKLACARLNNDRDALLDACRERIAWLKKCPARTGEGHWPREPPFQVENARMTCAIAEAELKLARALGDRAAEKAAQGRTSRAARRLLDVMPWAGFEPFEFDAAGEAATRILWADEQVSETAKFEISNKDIELYESVVHNTRVLFDEGVQGGEMERMALMEIGLGLARARLARLQNDREAERLALKVPAFWAKNLREALEAAFNHYRPCDLLHAYRRADEAEIALARAEGNALEEQNAEAAARSRVANLWQRVSAPDYPKIHSIGGALIRCLYGIEKIEQRGRDFFDGPIRSLEPPDANTLPRESNADDSDRAIAVARSYFEKQHGEPVDGWFTARRDDDGYSVLVLLYARWNDDEPSLSVPGGRYLVTVSNDWKVSGVITGE